MKSKKFLGIGVSSGIVKGKAYLFSLGGKRIVKRKIKKEDIEKEKSKLRYAQEKTKEEIKDIMKNMEASLEGKFSQIFNIHLALLDDPMLMMLTEKNIKEGINASYAFQEAVKTVIEYLSLHPTQIGRTIEILHDISAKMFYHLGERDYKGLEDIDEKVILVAKNITPYDIVSIPNDKIAGIVCSMGTQTSHAAILARALRIPGILGIPDIENIIFQDDILILDGRKGLLVVNPGKKEDELYERRKKEEELEEIHFKEDLASLLPKTKDGHRINLVANIELLNEVYLTKEENIDGIGLLRSEFLFLKKGIPNEEEQYNSYAEIGDMVYPRYVTIRTLDITEDKRALFLKEKGVPSFSLKGIRLSLKYKDIFKTQLRAILLANKRGNIRVMFPMVTSAEELDAAISILSEAKEELKKEGRQFDEEIEVGTMIETPSSAITCDTLVPFVDFFSIGTNDLIQYTLVVDRTNPDTAYLYEPLHPSILRLIKNVIDVGHKAKISVGMCGEMASDPLYTPLLLGLSIDELSVNLDAMSKIRKVIRSITQDEAERIKDVVFSLNSPKEIRLFLEREAEKWKNH